MSRRGDAAIALIALIFLVSWVTARIQIRREMKDVEKAEVSGGMR